MRSTVCKKCHNIYYGRRWYSQNKEKVIKQVAIRRKNTKRKSKKYVLNFLKNHPCNVCGISDPAVLEFDHVNRKTKKTEISKLIAGGYSFKVIRDEIKKCQVLCANCHRKKTAKSEDWYKNIF